MIVLFLSWAAVYSPGVFNKVFYLVNLEFILDNILSNFISDFS